MCVSVNYVLPFGIEYKLRRDEKFSLKAHVRQGAHCNVCRRNGGLDSQSIERAGLRLVLSTSYGHP